MKKLKPEPYPIPNMYGNLRLIAPSWYQPPPEPAVETEFSKVYTVAEAARALGLGLTTTKSLIASGELPSAMLRRRRVIRREAVEAFLAKRERGDRRRR